MLSSCVSVHRASLACLSCELSLSDRVWALWSRVKSADSSTGARSVYKTWHPLSGRACALCRHAFSTEASVGPRSGYNARPASSRGGFSFSSEGRSGSLARRCLTSFWRASKNFLRWVSAISVLRSASSLRILSASRLMRSSLAAVRALGSTISVWLSSLRSPRRRLGVLLPDGAGPSCWVAATLTRLFPLSRGEPLSVPSVGGPGVPGAMAPRRLSEGRMDVMRARVSLSLSGCN